MKWNEKDENCQLLENIAVHRVFKKLTMVFVTLSLHFYKIGLFSIYPQILRKVLVCLLELNLGLRSR